MELTKTINAKGYKKTEVGLIPEDWKVSTLDEVTTLMTNGFVGTATTEYTEENDGVLYIQGYNVEANSFNFNGIKRVNQNFHKKHLKSCLNEGDLLTVQTGDVGLTTIVSKELEGSNCHALIISRFKLTKVYPWFYTQYFNSFIGRNRLKELEIGTTMKHLNVGDMKNWQIPIPPLSEQKAIATALSDVDALLLSLDKQIAKKKAIKQGAMQELLTIDKFWIKKSLLELAENKKELFDDGDWIESEHITNKGIRLIQTGNIGVGRFIEKENKKYISEDSFQKLNCKKLEIGDVLICRLAEPAGRACIFPYIGERKVITSVDVTIFRPDNKKVNREFLNQIFSTNDYFKLISEKVGGTTHKRISRGSLGQISVFIPPLQEQKAIAQILSDMDLEIASLEAKRQKYVAIKQGMMQELLTGRTRLV